MAQWDVSVYTLYVIDYQIVIIQVKS